MNTSYIAQTFRTRPEMFERSGNNWLHGLFSLLMLVILVAGVIWVAKILVQHTSATSGADKHDPLDTAKERYAKGEITKEQLDEIRKELSK